MSRKAILVESIDIDELVARVTESVVERITPLLDQRTQKRLLDREGMAAVLGVGVATFDQYRAAGTVPTKWIRSAPRFDPDEVIAALPTHPQTTRKASGAA